MGSVGGGIQTLFSYLIFLPFGDVATPRVIFLIKCWGVFRGGFLIAMFTVPSDAIDDQWPMASLIDQM